MDIMEKAKNITIHISPKYRFSYDEVFGIVFKVLCEYPEIKYINQLTIIESMLSLNSMYGK